MDQCLCCGRQPIDLELGNFCSDQCSEEYMEQFKPEDEEE